RHTENADSFGCFTDAFELVPALFQIGAEAGHIGPRFGKHLGDDNGILDVELAPPEALEDDVVIAAQDCVAMALREQHAAQRNLRIPDFLRPADHQPALTRLAPAIHVAVPDAAPL